MKIFRHFLTITAHRHRVMWYCFKSGLYLQGLLHDLSKYSFTEFFRSAKYYVGTKSPIGAERRNNGYSIAWLHHKGRNKHHSEYWIDLNLETRKYEPIRMPNKYIAESFLDHLAASKVYNKKNFKPEMLLEYYLTKEKPSVPMHEDSRKILEMLFSMYIEKGEKEVFKYIKKNLRK